MCVKLKKKELREHKRAHTSEHMDLLLQKVSDLKRANTSEHMDLLQKVSDLRIENEDLKRQLRATTGKVCTFFWRIKNWPDVLQEAKNHKCETIYSESFYTGYPGYKLRLMFKPNKTKGGSHEFYVGVLLQVLKGEYDDLLEWPFPLKYKLFIVDQQPNVTAANLTKIVDPIKWLHLDVEEVLKKPTAEYNKMGFGFLDFATHHSLQTRTYIRKEDKSLLIKIEVYN